MDKNASLEMNIIIYTKCLGTTRNRVGCNAYKRRWGRIGHRVGWGSLTPINRTKQ